MPHPYPFSLPTVVPAVPIPSVSLAQGFDRAAYTLAAVQTLPLEALRRTDRNISTHERSRLTTRSTVGQMFVKVEPIDPEAA